MRATKEMNTNKGITLIALIITIIVMLILAGVTIKIVNDGGLFDKAKEAVGKTENAIRQEQQLINDIMDEYFGINGDSGDSGVTLPTYANATKINGYLTEKATYSDGVEEKPAVIPAGYKLVNEGEKIANGIVIADSNGNEFVWIPVEKAIVTETEIAKIKEDNTDITTDYDAVQKMVTDGIYPMAVQVGENYKGILYEFSGTDTLTATVYDWTSEYYREPANLEDYYFDYSTRKELDFKYDSQDAFTKHGLGMYTETLYQESYNKMIESALENGGFYVGRYEISAGTYTLADSSTITYAQSKVNQTALVSVTWYEMYKYERDYAKYNTNLGVTSEMIWGSQWDQMMIFVNSKNDGGETPEPFYVAQTGSRNSDDWSGKTGINTVDQVANIFDLEANMFELTQEAGHSYIRVSRGAGFGYVASSRLDYDDDVYPTSSGYYDTYSSRISLYIK